MDEIKVIIAGGRKFDHKNEDNYRYVCRCMEGVKAIHQDKRIRVVSGGANGADTLGERWSQEMGYGLPALFEPEYDKYSPKRAPLIRNSEMAVYGDVLCAFWDGKSGGTRNMIGCAIRHGLDIHVFRVTYGAQETQL